MKYIITIIIIFLLIGCLFHVPYGYFQFVRLIFFAGFMYLAYLENEPKKIFIRIIYVVLALFLQPFEKVHFTRTTWNLIDEILAGLLTIWIVIQILLEKWRPMGE